MSSLWFDPDPPSMSAEEEARLERINRGETDEELQQRLDRSLSIANAFVTLFSRHNEILRPATEVKASADTQRPNACEPPQDHYMRKADDLDMCITSDDAEELLTAALSKPGEQG